MTKEKKSLWQKLGDITHIHHRAAFTDVEKHATLQSNFLTLAKERYSCRKYSAVCLTEKEIDNILQAAAAAPSAMNKQPVHVWAVTSDEGLEKLKKTTEYTYGAPAVFLVGCKEEEAWVRKYDGKNGAEVDAAIVGTHIMLEAASIGLGSVWVGSFDPAKVKELFPQTAEWTPVAMFPVGHPADIPSPRHTERKSLEDFTTRL